MANSNGWGDGAANNAIGWGQGANNAIAWGDSHAKSWAGATDIVGLTTDPDAQAFITAAAITDATQQAAIDNLVKGLKSDNIWTKMKAIYPFVGGTASTHKWNLKDPRDLDAAFRLVFNGGWTHSSNGATPNGTNGYADTKLVPSSVFGSNYASQGAYFRTAFTLGQTNISGTTNGTQRFDFGYDNGYLVPFNAIGSNNSDVSSDTDNKGLIVATRQGASVVKLFRNNVLKVNGTQSFSSYPALNYFIAARNAGTPQLFSNMGNLSFHFIADGLSNTEAANLYTRVQAFQTALSRNV
jgi:hypothetical protein